MRLQQSPLQVPAPHGTQNYHRPRHHQLLRKETLIGPVTAVAIPCFKHQHTHKHEDEDEHEHDGDASKADKGSEMETYTSISTDAYLVARGPFVELTFDHDTRSHSHHDLSTSSTWMNKKFRFLAFSGSEGGTVHGMKKCVGSIVIEHDQTQKRESKDLWMFYGGRMLSFVLIDSKINLKCDDDHDDLDNYSPFSKLPVTTDTCSRTRTRTEGNLSIEESYHASDWIHDVRAIQVPVRVPDNEQRGEGESTYTSTSTCNSFRLLVALGLAHNCVEIISMSSKRGGDGKLSLASASLRKIVCEVRCITYSLNFFGWKPESFDLTNANLGLDLAVVVGTVSNEVLVWNVIDENEENEQDSILKVERSSSSAAATATRTGTTIVKKKVLHRLIGHEGVIHSVKVGCGGKYLVSTSDDRTIRLWGQSGNTDTISVDANGNVESHLDVKRLSNDKCRFQLLWTSFGHSARVWDSDFISLNNDYCRNRHDSGCGGIVTVGEDSTIRIWNIDDGAELAILRGHGCRNIWKVSSSNRTGTSSPCTILTGGNDGTAKIWDLDHHLIHNASTIKPSLEDDNTPHPTLNMIEIPEDDISLIKPKPAAPIIDVIEHVSNEVDGKKKKKRKKQKKAPLHRQTVCGTSFYPESNSMVVATRAGTLMTVDFDKGKWTKHCPWSQKSRSNEELADPAKGSCMAMHSSGKAVALGTSRGEIVLCSTKPGDTTEKIVFNASQYPAIQSLHWLDSNNLLAFHIKGIAVWWRFDIDLSASDDIVFGSLHKPFIKCVLSMARDGLVVGIPMAYYHDYIKKFMYMGDSRGNLAVFDTSDDESIGTVRSALDILSYTHKKEYVTGIIPCLDGKGVLSVGNDGFIHEAGIESSDGVTKLLNVIRRPVPCLTGISHIWRSSVNGSPNSILVAGYHGNMFIVWDQSVGYQLLGLDTGGRNRQLDLRIAFNNGLRSSSHDIAILIANKNAPNELLLHRHSRQFSRPSPSQYNLGVACHGETVLDVAFCGTTSDGKTLLLSGSNDCTSKLYIVEAGEIRLVSELQPHESCVRAVCSSRHAGSRSSLLVVSGGKLQSSFYRLEEVDEDAYRVIFLCNNKLQEKPAIDQRMNAVDAVPLTRKESSDQSHLVASGDSDGGLHLAIVTEEIGQSSQLATFKLAQEQRPILSVKMKVLPNGKILLCAGNTAGEVFIWILPDSIDCNLTNLPSSPVHVYQGNQVGTNSLAVGFNYVSDDNQQVLILSGGDDQAISCSIVDISIGAEDIISTIRESMTYKEACGSAIKGIAITGDAKSGFRVYTTGYDNRLSIWLLTANGSGTKGASLSQNLQYLSSAPVEIKDINSLDCCRVRDSNGAEKDLLVAGGEGLELLSFDLNIWKAAQALKKCNYLLITCGAGFSQDSGLATYETMPEEYRDLCNPLRLVDQTSTFQRFWSRFSETYQNTESHSGYKILEQWCGSNKLENLITETENRNNNRNGDHEDLTETSPWWIYSSNVDGHFSRSKCFSETICEIHGNASHFRCSHAMGNTTATGQKRQGATWDPWHEKVASISPSDECCSSVTFPVSEEAEEILCRNKSCSLPARPNVLLFHDVDVNVLNSINNQRDRYQRWEERVENDVVQHGSNLVIIELGAGLSVPAVRNETEEVFNDTAHRLKDPGTNSNSKSNGNGSVTCIRINPKDAGFEVKKEDDRGDTVSIYDKAESALKMIDNALSCIN